MYIKYLYFILILARIVWYLTRKSYSEWYARAAAFLGFKATVMPTTTPHLAQRKKGGWGDKKHALQQR